MPVLDDIKGIAFRKDDQIIQTANRPYIQDLDALPLPAYKLLTMDKYNITGRNLLSVITSRGCPYQCPFCVASQMFGAPFRARSPKNVLDEMEWLRDEFGAEGIAFQDDTLTFDQKRARRNLRRHDRAKNEAALGMRNPRRRSQQRTL